MPPQIRECERDRILAPGGVCPPAGTFAEKTREEPAHGEQIVALEQRAEARGERARLIAAQALREFVPGIADEAGRLLDQRDVAERTLRERRPLEHLEEPAVEGADGHARLGGEKALEQSARRLQQRIHLVWRDRSRGEKRTDRVVRF